MNETEQLLRRLERIGHLRATAAHAAVLDELRAFVPEVEAWARTSAGGRVEAPAEKLREEVGGMR